MNFLPKALNGSLDEFGAADGRRRSRARSDATNPIPADANSSNTPSMTRFCPDPPAVSLSLAQINPGPGGEQLAAVHRSCFTYMRPYKQERRASGINALAC